MDTMEAAQSLVIKLDGPPQAHSIFVRTSVDPVSGEFVRSLCVSVHPKFKGKIKVPTIHEGFVVEPVKWPRGLE